MNHEFWYLSRAAGFTAYGLLFVSTALGLAISTRFGERFARRNATFDLHRFTSLLALAFTLLHVYVLLLDGYFDFSARELSLPFASPYRPWQTALGVLSLYALVVLIASFYVRRFIGYRMWRTLHYLAFALYAGATLHGITAGSDTQEPWARAIYLATGGAVLALVLYRAQSSRSREPRFRIARMAASLAAIAVAGGLAFGSGLLDGRGSGTTKTQAAAPAEAQASPGPFAFLETFEGELTGRYSQTANAAVGRLVVDGTATGEFPLRLRIELVSTRTQPARGDEDDEYEEHEGEGEDDEEHEHEEEGEDEDGHQTRFARAPTVTTLNTARVLDPDSGALLCDGSLTTLDRDYLSVTCNGAGPYAGVRMALAMRILGRADGTFSGPLSGSMARLD